MYMYVLFKISNVGIEFVRLDENSFCVSGFVCLVMMFLWEICLKFKLCGIKLFIRELFLFGLVKFILVLFVLDGMYIYIQKFINFSFFRCFFSLYKYRLFVKFMMVVIIFGYIVFVQGLYLFDFKNNDVGIFNYMIKKNVEEMRSWLNDGDMFIVDCGFRDSVDVLFDIGIWMEMLCFFRGIK